MWYLVGQYPTRKVWIRGLWNGDQSTFLRHNDGQVRGWI